MALTTDERRFLREWQIQTESGKWNYVLLYWLAYFLIIFLVGVAIGLFSGIPFIRVWYIIALAALALIAGLILALAGWNRNQRRFKKMIQKALQEGISSN